MLPVILCTAIRSIAYTAVVFTSVPLITFTVFPIHLGVSYVTIGARGGAVG
jgi:hypothetical protein